jgi:hypothetical protein
MSRVELEKVFEAALLTKTPKQLLQAERTVLCIRTLARCKVRVNREKERTGEAFAFVFLPFFFF